MSHFHNVLDSPAPVNFVTFNQDYTSLAVGTKTGYKVFALNALDSLDLIYENASDSISIVERLFSSSLLVVVHLSSPRTLRVLHFRKEQEICNYCYSNTVLTVKLNRSRLVVALEGSLHIHNIRDMRLLHTIKETPSNPGGLLTLSISSENCFLAYPGSSTIGEVQIFDAGNLHAKTMIPAHDSPLAALMFCPAGRMLATASEKGTVIRVFSVQDGTKIYEFRRGVKRCVSISSLIFSTDSNYLCCSSNTETVHIFKLEDLNEPVKQQTEEDTSTWMGLFNKAVNVTSQYLPSQVTEVLSQGRAFATVHLPFYGLRNSCAITSIQKVLRLLVAASDGFLYIYNFDGTDGGACTLIKKHSLIDKEGTSTPNNSAPVEAGSVATGSVNTYAGILKGKSSTEMSGTCMESEKAREMALATESPTKGGFTFDENEFPPVSYTLE